jgi:hypothetical protein
MPSTYTPIATTTLGSATQTVTFTSIPATYTDLRLVISNTKHSFAGTGRVFDSVLQFNNDTASNYSSTNLLGDGSSASSTRSSSATSLQVHWSRASDDPGLLTFDIMNYANTTTYKTAVYRSSTANATAAAYVGLWRSTAAITEIDVTVSATYTISTGTVLTLYGIKAA